MLDKYIIIPVSSWAVNKLKKVFKRKPTLIATVTKDEIGDILLQWKNIKGVTSEDYISAGLFARYLYKELNLYRENDIIIEDKIIERGK